MIDLEERIAATLQDRAPVFVQQMPKGTVARVRIRQSIGSFATLALVAAFAVGAVALSSWVPRSVQPASRRTVQAPSGILPARRGSRGASTTRRQLPHPIPRRPRTPPPTAPTARFHTPSRWRARRYTSSPRSMSFGHVSGIEWSLAAYDTKPYSGDQFSRFLGGSCGDLMVGDQGEYGGIGFCLHTGETAPDGAFAMAGFGNASDRSVGPIVGYAGLVGSQVSSVELRLSGGETRQLPLYDAPSGIGARYFEVFVAEGTGGQIVALGSN